MINYKELISSLKEENFTLGQVNLHIHTNYSDGQGNFNTLIREAEEKNFKYISITDHNTMKGYEDCSNSRILIPGVEFDVWCGLVFIHLLAYGVDHNNSKLKPFFAKTKKETEWNITRFYPKRNIKKLIEAIHNAGGIAVLAHPACCLCFSLDRLVKKLTSYGLDGIEVYYPYPRFRKFAKFHKNNTAKKLAKKYNLIITGGTDLHKKHF